MLRLAVALIGAVLLTAQAPIQVASSQPPVPSAVKISQPDQQKRATEPKVSQENRAAPDNDATRSNLTFSPKISVEAGESASGSKQESSANWWLVIFTGGLLIAAIATYFTFRRQANIMENTLKQMGEDSKLAREKFVASQQPHLIVRNVNSREANPGDEIVIAFEVINNGQSDAHIVASAFRTDFVSTSETFHDLPLVAVGNPPKEEMKVRCIGPSGVYRGEFRPGGNWTADHFHDHQVPQAGYFWSGKILYRDQFGKNPRRLGIMRRLSLPSRRFRPVNDPEFEYDD